MNCERQVSKEAAYALLASNTLRLNASVSELAGRLDQVSVVDVARRQDDCCLAPMILAG
jgi:hypothetical protein